MLHKYSVIVRLKSNKIFVDISHRSYAKTFHSQAPILTSSFFEDDLTLNFINFKAIWFWLSPFHFFQQRNF